MTPRLVPRALAVLLATAALPLPGGCVAFDGATATQGYFDFAGATRVCARVFSCPGLAGSLRQSIAAPVDDQSFSVCVSWLAGPAPAPPAGFAAQVDVLQAVSAAASCADAETGLDVLVLPPAQTECPAGAGDHCVDEDHLADCAGLRVVSCGGKQFAPGSKCVASGSAATCSTGVPCSVVVTDLNACDDPQTLDLCVPGVNLKEQLACAAFGEGCAAFDLTTHLPGKLSLCTDAGNPAPASLCAGATGSGFTTCSSDGTTMVLCDQVRTSGTLTFGAIEVRYACSDLGLTCAGGGAGPIAYCAPPGAACTPTDPDVNACDGDHIDVCLAGSHVTLDCAAAGGSCQGSAGSARCVVSP
jgi:hypothetical protein